MRIKEHHNTRASSSHKHLIKNKNNDNFSYKIKAIVRNVGNPRIKEALFIEKLYPQINNRLELDTEYVINQHLYFKYIIKFKKRKKNEID